MWTEEQIQYLKENYKNKSLKELSEVFKKTPTAILHKASRLKIKKHNWWNQNELKEEFIKMKTENKSNHEIAKKFNLTYNTVATYCARFNVHGKNYKNWYEQGRLGEQIAEKFILESGWEIIEKGNRKGGIPTPYDFIIKNNNRKYIVDVKHGIQIYVKYGQLQRLLKFNLPILIIYITPEKKIYCIKWVIE